MKHALLFLLFVAAFSGCASSAQNKQLNDKVGNETAVQSNEELQHATEDLIEKAPSLTDEQRTRLKAIRAETHESLDKIHKESLRLRAVLIKDIISSENNDSEIKLIKSRLRKLEEQHIDVLFSAVDQANDVLGKLAVENKKMLEDTLREDHIEAHMDAHAP